MPDPHAPVVVGVAQLSQRPDDVTSALEAVAMMTEVTRAAALDAGAPRLAAAADVVAVVNGAWGYRDPARIVADSVGASSARTIRTTDGGNTPQLLLDVVAERIAAGALDVAVIVGAEMIWSRRRLRKAGLERPLTEQAESVEPDELLGKPLDMVSEHERARRFLLPVEIYPLFDTAIRHRRGESPDAHRDRIAGMWAGFNAVAVDNPHAWSRTPMTAEEIRNPSAANRMVAFPYTKAMCSNWDLDQAAALIVCSAEAAERHGVARDRWVFAHGGAEADDTAHLSNRAELGRSPAIAAAWSALAADRGVGIDDVAHLDIYSCFPSAVQAAAEAIGIDPDGKDRNRPLTVTGGLTFAGGPLNNYVTHSIAALVDVLRADPGSLGLATANGGFLTKHALGLYSTEPPATPFRRLPLGDDDVRHDRREAADGHVGTVTIEASTVMHDHTGPTRAMFAVLTPDGRRTVGSSDVEATMEAAMTTELGGTAADIDADGTVRL